MKKLFGIVLSTLFLITLAACTGGETTEDSALTAFTVDINPSILFVVDDDEIVVSFVLNNEDAEIVAADLEFLGLSAEDALALFIEAAIEAGYIDVDGENNAIFITTEEYEENDDDDEEGLPEFAKRLRERAETEFRGRGIGVAVMLGTLDEALLELAETYDIGLGRLKIMQAALDIDETLTIDEVLAMDMRDIVAIIHSSHEARMNDFRAERQEHAQAMREAMAETVRERLEEHRQAVENGDVELPDFDAIREQFRARAEELRDEYEARREARREAAQERRP